MKKIKIPKIKAIAIKIKPVKVSLKKPKKIKQGSDKVAKVMNEFKDGVLRSGSAKGPKVKSRRQAVAIALNTKKKK